MSGAACTPEGSGEPRRPGGGPGAEPQAAAGAQIALDVSDWSPALRAEYAEIARARLGAALSADELEAWLKAVDRRNRAHAGDALAEAEGEAAGEGLLERSLGIPGTLVRLRSETIAARIRIEAALRAETAGRADRGWSLRVGAYCLAHAGDREALGRLGVPAEARRTVEAWAAAELTCTEAVLEAVVGRLIEGLYPEPDALDAAEAAMPTDWPGILATLTEHLGGDPERWLYGVPWSQAVWLLRSVARRLRRRERAMAERLNQAVPMDPDAPEVRAIGLYRELRRKLMEAPEMKRSKVQIGDGRAIEIREMTYGELERVRAEGETLPMEWPLVQQFAGREAELAGLGVSEVRQLAEAVYSLTLGPEDGNRKVTSGAECASGRQPEAAGAAAAD